MTSSSALPMPSWEGIIELLESRAEPRFAEGPWNGSYLPQLFHRSATFSYEPCTPRLRVLDYEAYMSSIEHINRCLEWGWPEPGIELEYSWIDMWTEWAKIGRGDEYAIVALTQAKDREMGAAYIKPVPDSDDPYEAGLYTWVVEDALRAGHDLTLLQDVISWIDAEWDFDRVIHFTPLSYGRGLEVAADAGLRRVDSRPSQPTYACFEWVRGAPRHH
jgi:hypothetical protein